MPDDYEEYLKDTRVECKYGVNCYQKNSKHLEKYKHPSKTLAKVNFVLYKYFALSNN